VWVEKDCGEIVTTEGETIKLEKNTSHYLRRKDVFMFF